MRRKSFATIFVAATLVIAACGSDSKSASTSATTGGTTAVTTPAISPETVAVTPTTGGGDIGTVAEASNGPIVIGAAIDLTGNMAPFDAPALASAQIAVKKINAAGGILGRQVELKFIDDKLDPAATKAAAVELITKDNADVLLTTCDVDFATPRDPRRYQCRPADHRTVHRHRPDGPVAVR